MATGYRKHSKRILRIIRDKPDSFSRLKSLAINKVKETRAMRKKELRCFHQSEKIAITETPEKIQEYCHRHGVYEFHELTPRTQEKVTRSFMEAWGNEYIEGEERSGEYTFNRAGNAAPGVILRQGDYYWFLPIIG